jgi:prevent-host-death family protein
MRRVYLVEARAGLSALLDAVEAGEEVVITRRGRSVARVIRVTGGEAGSAVELLRELRDQEP